MSAPASDIVGRDASDLAAAVSSGELSAVEITQAHLDQVDRQMGDVDADPPALQSLRRDCRRAAATEWVQHYVAFLAGCIDDAL